jgi:hypothetical protein
VLELLEVVVEAGAQSGWGPGYLSAHAAARVHARTDDCRARDTDARYESRAKLHGRTGKGESVRLLASALMARTRVASPPSHFPSNCSNRKSSHQH